MSSFFINENYSEEPLIFICAKNKNYYMIEFLLRNGIDINLKFRNEYLLTILVKNMASSHFLIRYIKIYNADINICDNDGTHLLFLLLNNPNYHHIMYYIIYHKYDNIDLNMIGNNGCPLILSILESGYTEISLHMINLGCNINIFLSNGDPMIFKILREKKFNIANFLFSTRKLDIYCKNKFTNMSLFELLVTENLYTFVKYILETYNFIIPYTIIGEHSLIETAARNNNNLILNKLILYECAKVIQKNFRRYKYRHILHL
jgi:hypothetical protein